MTQRQATEEGEEIVRAKRDKNNGAAEDHGVAAPAKGKSAYARAYKKGKVAPAMDKNGWEKAAISIAG